MEFFEDGRPLEEQLKDTVLSKSGFTQRMMDIAKESTGILLVNEDHLV